MCTFAHHQRQAGKPRWVGLGRDDPAGVNDADVAGVLPDGDELALFNRDYHAVRPEPDHPGALDPADLLDAAAHGVQIEGGERRAARQGGRPQDIGGGLRRRSLKSDGGQTWAKPGRLARDCRIGGGDDAFATAPSRQHGGQAANDEGAGDDQDGAWRKAECSARRRGRRSLGLSSAAAGL